jgi:hypothetical protein
LVRYVRDCAGRYGFARFARWCIPGGGMGLGAVLG